MMNHIHTHPRARIVHFACHYTNSQLTLDTEHLAFTRATLPLNSTVPKTDPRHISFHRVTMRAPLVVSAHTLVSVCSHVSKRQRDAAETRASNIHAKPVGQQWVIVSFFSTYVRV